MTRKQDSAKKRNRKEGIRERLQQDQDLLKALIQEAVQEALEAEMDEALQAEKGSGHRTGWGTARATTAGAW